MVGPLMKSSQAQRRYKVKLPFSPRTEVYHRGKRRFSARDFKLDEKIISGPMKNRIGGRNDPYAHTHDEYMLDKNPTSGVKARGLRKNWSTWKKLKDKKKLIKKLRAVAVRKNKPTAVKPRKKHTRKKPGGNRRWS